MLAKATWDLMAQAERTWVKIFSFKHLREATFWLAHQRGYDLYIWKGILWTRDALEKKNKREHVVGELVIAQT